MKEEIIKITIELVIDRDTTMDNEDIKHSIIQDLKETLGMDNIDNNNVTIESESYCGCGCM